MVKDRRGHLLIVLTRSGWKLTKVRRFLFIYFPPPVRKVASDHPAWVPHFLLSAADVRSCPMWITPACL